MEAGDSPTTFPWKEKQYSAAPCPRLFESIGKGEFTVPSDVDPLLESLIRGMLRFEPDQRFPVADVMAHDWYEAQTKHNIHLQTEQIENLRAGKMPLKY